MKRPPLLALFIAFVTLTFARPSDAMWIPVDTISVPVDRVLTNLTRRAATETNNFELIHAIARLHSLSYARAASNWLVNIGTNRGPSADRFAQTKFVAPAQTNGLPYFGHNKPMPPNTVEQSKTPEATSAAKDHLQQAINFYRHATQLRSTNEFPWIGLGWCQLQNGQTNEAKESLRRGIKVAWAHEKYVGVTFEMLTPSEEAIDYLRPLLDPLKDSAELSELDTIKASAEKLSRAVTPLVLPLQPNLTPADLINPTASVQFDLDGSGVPDRRWQWITTNAAWIVHLPQGGQVTSALQLFGNVTFWLFWQNGYHALASLDDNNDGLLTGDELRGLALWQDLNSDGHCDPNEILTLQQLGITALDTHYTTTDQILTSPQGARFHNNTTRPTYDLIFEQQRATLPTP